MAEDDGSEFIAECLAEAPEPYRTVIKRWLDDGLFAQFLETVQQRYSLSEDQMTKVTILTFRASCEPSLVEDLKDVIIADVDVSYEQAVKIQADIVRNVLVPITKEGKDLPTPRDEKPPPHIAPSRSEPVHLYEDDYLRISPTQLVKGGVTYSASTIASVIRPMRLSVFDDFGGFTINAVLLAGGVIGVLVGISSLNILIILGGLAAGALGYFNVKGILNSKWWVTVELVTGEKVRIERQKKEDIDAIYSALSEIV